MFFCFVSEIYKLRFLAVDDDPQPLKTLAWLLSRQFPDAFIDKFLSPVSALESIAQEKFDVIFSDVEMPEIDGFELFRKAQEITPDVPVILMSGMDCYAARARALGMGFVKKPYDYHNLVAVAKKYIPSRLGS